MPLVSGHREQNLAQVFLERKGQEATGNRPLDTSRIHTLRTSHCKVICLTRKLLLVSITKSDPSSRSHRPLVRRQGWGAPQWQEDQCPMTHHLREETPSTEEKYCFSFPKISKSSSLMKTILFERTRFCALLFKLHKDHLSKAQNTDTHTQTEEPWAWH